MIPVGPMGAVDNTVEDNLGIRIKRIKKKIKKDKKKLYQGVNQGYQGVISPLFRFFPGPFLDYFRAYLSIVGA